MTRSRIVDRFEQGGDGGQEHVAAHVVGDTDEQQQALRAQLSGMWASVAGSWGEYADYADARGAAVTARMLQLTAPQQGDRVLELACGAGGVGLAAASLVGATGEVVLSDVVAEMTSIAGLRALEAGLGNVTTRRLALEDIDEPDGSFDVVLCREGLMFAIDPGRALAEIRRVLRSGGRVAVAVWGPRMRNPWLGLVFDAVSAQLGTPLPPPGVPGPFSLADTVRLAALFGDADFAQVDVTELPTPLLDKSFDDWWVRTSSLAGPLAKRLATLPDGAMRALRGRLKQAVRPYETPAGLEFPGVTLLASGRRDAAPIESG